LSENETCTNKSIVVKAKEKVNVELRLKINIFREKKLLNSKGDLFQVNEELFKRNFSSKFFFSAQADI